MIDYSKSHSDQITNKWLYEIGATYKECDDEHYGEWRLWDGRLYWWLIPTNGHPFRWFLMGVEIPAPKTKEDVRVLCRVLGIKLKG